MEQTTAPATSQFRAMMRVMDEDEIPVDPCGLDPADRDRIRQSKWLPPIKINKTSTDHLLHRKRAIPNYRPARFPVEVTKEAEHHRRRLQHNAFAKYWDELAAVDENGMEQEKKQVEVNSIWDLSRLKLPPVIDTSLTLTGQVTTNATNTGVKEESKISSTKAQNAMKDNTKSKSFSKVRAPIASPAADVRSDAPMISEHERVLAARMNVHLKALQNRPNSTNTNQTPSSVAYLANTLSSASVNKSDSTASDISVSVPPWWLTTETSYVGRNSHFTASAKRNNLPLYRYGLMNPFGETWKTTHVDALDDFLRTSRDLVSLGQTLQKQTQTLRQDGQMLSLTSKAVEEVVTPIIQPEEKEKPPEESKEISTLPALSTTPTITEQPSTEPPPPLSQRVRTSFIERRKTLTDELEELLKKRTLERQHAQNHLDHWKRVMKNVNKTCRGIDQSGTVTRREVPGQLWKITEATQ